METKVGIAARPLFLFAGAGFWFADFFAIHLAIERLTKKATTTAPMTYARHGSPRGGRCGLVKSRGRISATPMSACNVRRSAQDQTVRQKGELASKLMHVHDAHDRRAHDDNKEARQEKEEHGNRQLRRQRRGLLLCLHHALFTVFLRRDAQRLADRRAVFLCLIDGCSDSADTG